MEIEDMNDIKDFMTYFNNIKTNSDEVVNTPVATSTVVTETLIVPTQEPIIIQNEVEPIQNEIVESIVIPQPKKEEIKEDNNFYKIYRDKGENFNCEISVEGAAIDSTTVRLLFITEEWNVFIDGTIDNQGNVSIPIKKMNLFKEGTCGTLKMEVVADNTVFVPWETEFEIKESKKVLVTFNENKQIQETKSVNVKMK